MVCFHNKKLALLNAQTPFTFFIPSLFLRLLPSTYWQTEFGQQSITTQNIWGKTIVIPWSEVNLMDITGLSPVPPSLLKVMKSPKDVMRLNERRSLLLRIKDSKVLESACRGAPGKTSMAAQDILSIRNIALDQAELLIEELKKISLARGIPEGQICLDWEM